jgi:hypothetical protein
MFTDHSTNIGNLFVVIGSAEPNNNVVLHMVDHKAFVIKTGYQANE